MKNWRELCEKFIIEKDEANQKRIVDGTQDPLNLLEEEEDMFATDDEGRTTPVNADGAGSVEDVMDKAGDAKSVTVGDFSITKATDQQKAGESEDGSSDFKSPHPISEPLDLSK